MLLRLIKLDLFAPEGGGEGAGAAQNSSANTPAEAGEVVLYGKQTPDAGSNAIETSAKGSDAANNENASSSTLDDKRKAYQDLVNGEYKDQYTEDMQRIINRRFKETKGLQEQLGAMQGLKDILAARYGVTDVNELAKAIEEDTAFWSKAADEAGMTVEQYKKVQKLQQENERLLQSEQKRQLDSKVQAQMTQWAQEEMALQQKFKGFSLANEMKDPQFMAMLKAGLPMEHAYKVQHMDEIIADAKMTTAATVEKATVDNIRAKGARPRENGASPQSAFITKDDVSKLTKKDRADIARRVARGEHIEF